MAQLSYPNQMPAAFAGMKSSAVNDTVDTGISEETSAVIPFGVGVVQGSSQDGVKLPAASTDLVLGINIHDYAAFLDTATLSGVAPASPLNVGRKGRCWVTVEDAVTPASKVYMRYAAHASFTQPGAFRGSADTGAGEVYGCQYKGSAAGGGLVELEYDFLTNKGFVDHG